MSAVSLKLVPAFRNHLLIVVFFVEGYLKCVEHRITLDHEDVALPPEDFFVNITSTKEIVALRQTLLNTVDDEVVYLSDRENVLFYACFVLMSYGLITPLGEMLSEEILIGMPEDHPFREFAEFRKNSLAINAHLIENAEDTLNDIPGFEEMKKALSELTTE